MRLDKWLKLSRVIKRRPVANEVCDQGRVEINGRVAKASSEVKPGDVLVIHFGGKTLTLTILAVPEKPVAAQAAADLYRIDSEMSRKPDNE